MSKYGQYPRGASVSSERTLDDLEVIPSTDHTPVHSPPTSAKMEGNVGPNYHAGTSRPPHHGRGSPNPQEEHPVTQVQHRVSWHTPGVTEVRMSPENTDHETSEFALEYVQSPSQPCMSPSRSIHGHITPVAMGTDSSPIRRLKRKDAEHPPARVERELSDAYIESISRTPRYELGRHNTYDDILQQMSTEDPFKGNYQPSGKSPVMERSRAPQPRQRETVSRKENLNKENDDIDRFKKKNGKKRRRKKEDDSGERLVNGGYESRTNKAYTGDGDSLKSNDTFTVQGERRSRADSWAKEIRSSVTNLAGPILKKMPSKIKSVSESNKGRDNMYSKQEQMDNQALTEFVNKSGLMLRQCKVYVHNRRAKKPVCYCGREKSWHEERGFPEDNNVWHYHTHSMDKPTDSFGVVQFDGFCGDSLRAPYVRLGPDSDLEMVWDLMTKHWHLPIPKLLISVTGGAQRFDLNHRLKQVFKRGLINAATTTGAWIITGGTATGVMQFVGEAVQDQISSGIKGENNVVAIGIATWGCIANREALDGEDLEEGQVNPRLFPAHYMEEDVSEIQGRDVPLDHNHTHFLLVDDGTEGKFGGEIEFRSMLERYVSEKVETGVAETQSVNVPVVQLVLEGGVGTMKTVMQAVQQNIPVLILEGSGRAADFISFGYNLSKDPRNDEMSRFGNDFDEEMKIFAEDNFALKPSDDRQKKIAELMRQLKGTLEKRKLVNIFSINQADTKDIDRAILYALLKANKTNANAQLSLALAWNRCDIARHEIFTQENRQYWKKMNKIYHGFGKTNIPLYDAMFTALVQDRTDFVQLFLENGVSLRKFLSVDTLWNLYGNSLKDTSDTMAQLVANLIVYLKGSSKFKQSWGAYLACQDTRASVVDSELLPSIGRLIVHLMGDENINPYHHTDSGESFIVNIHQPELKWLAGNHENRMNKSGTLTARRSNTLNGKQFFKPRRNDNWCDFTDSTHELFIFAILLNRRELGKMMWKVGQDQLGAALVACAILKGLSKVADDEEELELSIDLLDHANMYEDMAYGVLSECYKRDKLMAHQLLVRRLENYGATTVFSLADTHTLMKFMGHTSCQTKLNLIWKGRMALYTQTWKICLSLLFPFFVPSIKFTTSDSVLDTEDGSVEDYDDIDEGEEEVVQKKEDIHVISNKVMPNNKGQTEDEIFVRAKSRRKHKPHKKLYKVQMFGETRKGAIGMLDAFYYFYTAPVSVFTINTVSYLVFLALFSYFVLVDLQEFTSPFEYIIWGWTVTMFLEEIRQLVASDRRSLLYKMRSWSGSLWNRFDLSMYLIFILSVILRFTLSGKDFVYVRIFYSITVAMYFLRFMQVFFVEKNIGPKVIMIKNMLIDLMFFLGIFLVFLLSFGIMYQANLFPNSPANWRLLKNVLYIPYWQMYGELFLEDMEGEPPAQCTNDENVWRAAGGANRCPEQIALVPLLAAVYLILTNILLVNLLIAMFSYTFQVVQDKSEQVWRYYRYSLVHEFYNRPVFCPPFIILSHCYRLIIYCCRKGCGMGKYKNEFKLKLDEKDNTRLRLFVRSATECYLTTTMQAEREELGNKVSNTANRLEKVIEELDNIKESVKLRPSPILDENRSPGDTLDRSITTTPRRQSIAVSSSVGQLQGQIDNLSQRMGETSSQMSQIMLMLETVIKQQKKTPHLDISEVNSSNL
ncbi:transient receptor potential cation channel subfamily M member 2-like isoform X2 [Mya arenaria]|uniref:transient receptor potential cation channel subfamily M member 2-like isoform X2 n=1 Tax=Mya arenaria TaxID=6604 RepID=UPI0022E0B02B|nr:transient receptor potential cation channel subfamily M member 2-like isoform X2 [Mya arenaria]